MKSLLNEPPNEQNGKTSKKDITVKMYYNYGQLIFNEQVTTEEMFKWCEENLTSGEVVVGGTTIFIESEIDATAFVLKWL